MSPTVCSVCKNPQLWNTLWFLALNVALKKEHVIIIAEKSLCLSGPCCAISMLITILKILFFSLALGDFFAYGMNKAAPAFIHTWLECSDDGVLWVMLLQKSLPPQPIQGDPLTATSPGWNKAHWPTRPGVSLFLHHHYIVDTLSEWSWPGPFLCLFSSWPVV